MLLLNVANRKQSICDAIAMLTCSGIVLQKQLVVNAMDTQIDIQVDAYFLFYSDSCTSAMARKKSALSTKNPAG